jgi:hypothetical protein
VSALNKVLRLSGNQAAPAEEDPAAEQVLALASALDELRLYFASSGSDDDGDDDSSGGDDGDEDDQGGGHSDHATYKALCKKGVKPAMAAKMCAKADKKVKASVLAESACVILAGLVGGDVPVPEPEPTYLGRVVALAAKAMDDGGVPMHHGPFDGTHAHSHRVTAAHAHPHQHFGDNNHEGGPQHRQGSKPGQGRFGDY